MAVVNRAALDLLRTETGEGLDRIFGCFKADGAASVRPAHRLKGEAMQFGAEALSALAAAIERGARRSVEDQTRPHELIAAVLLRPLFDGTVTALERQVPAEAPAPVPAGAPASAMRRAPGGFGRRAAGFGRA